ncbi:putative cupin superfamily sugar epimerase [Planomicrobium stackebrandtii]|uniref:Cupin superfamily sugar epimerase n=1 Tax=Planomicrobium stackebrandtii TaxID=253160 RepID=A0ABU0GQ91_9BACL|nr:cupin domain-containing protein [Planomicrobium stackebrandtii]MDQ0427516.1 putative cupin superfamily sugar epimerase [Planomicrobium stackebrandtii]
MNAEDWITHLDMAAHPEGGYFKQSFVSPEKISLATHPAERNLFTSIYFLLRSQDISHFHRLKSDELWYFHMGNAVMVHILDAEGNYRAEKLGLDLAGGERPQVLVEKGSIFGSTVDAENTFSLVGCMVSPGFDFADFELLKQAELLQLYPEQEQVIKKLAYE